MTGARYPAWRAASGNSSRGFTLLEILLVIAIMGLLATVLIGGAAQWLTPEPVTAEDVFWKSVQEARKTALKAEHEIRLRFDREKKRFLILDGIAPTVLAPDGFTQIEAPLQQFPIPAATPQLEVDFLAPRPGGNAILVRGVLIEAAPIPYVTFYADGTCSPFRMQIFRGESATTLSIDPWTCAPVLEKKGL